MLDNGSVAMFRLQGTVNTLLPRRQRVHWQKLPRKLIIELLGQVSAIRYAKNLPQGDYNRYNHIGDQTERSETTGQRNEIRSNRKGDLTIRSDQIRPERR
jgi:hypothetical protein